MVIEEVNTNPKKFIATATGYELIHALIERIMCQGDINTITLIDQNRIDYEIIVDFISDQEREAIENIIEFWSEDDWEEAYPVIKVILTLRNKTWLQAKHEVKIDE